MREHKRLFWPIVTAVLIGLPTLYVLSIGPITGLASRGILPKPMESRVMRIYATPINLSWNYGPEWWRNLLDAYLDRWR